MPPGRRALGQNFQRRLPAGAVSGGCAGDGGGQGDGQDGPKPGCDFSWASWPRMAPPVLLPVWGPRETRQGGHCGGREKRPQGSAPGGCPLEPVCRHRRVASRFCGSGLCGRALLTPGPGAPASCAWSWLGLCSRPVSLGTWAPAAWIGEAPPRGAGGAPSLCLQMRLGEGMSLGGEPWGTWGVSPPSLQPMLSNRTPGESRSRCPIP